MSRTESVSKICTREGLLALRDAALRDGRRVVHCHGCFDIVHPGHIRHLRQARQLGDVLLITITGDAGIGKGVGRPLIPQELRAENLAALDFVDWVYIEPSATAVGLLDAVRPDVYVKGQEYATNQHAGFAAERDAVERHGGRVVFTSGDVVFSSTALIAGMAESINPADARIAELLRHPALLPEQVQLRLAGFAGKKAVVVGEVIEDRYVFCDPPGVAGESPVLALRPIQERSFDGGAAVVARHLAALGAEATLVTALPRDPAVADALRERLAGEGVRLAFVHQETPVASKHRFIVGHEKVVKVDWVRQAVLDAREQDRLVALADEHASGCDAAIVTDFGLGLLSAVMLERITGVLRPRVGVLAGDVSGHRNHLRAMRRMDLVTPSESELRAAARMYDESLPAVAWQHLNETGSRAMIVTMGAEGLVTFEPLESEKTGGPDAEAWRSRLKSEHVPALSGHVVDALGCGDALLAAGCLTLASGGSLLESAFVGALAASIHGSRIGNVPVDIATLRRRVESVGASALSFVPADVLAARVVPRVTHLAS
ncbi:MAG: PfkB family carbohydrate kinase [Phycisphaerales bacterium]|nr:adenylyltransferase/cytidyltransferase family protein [Planctomycetota bacterium]MCH8509426.1 PfkB family carbohydrate kinase [Phycisphaerales bacterium]